MAFGGFSGLWGIRDAAFITSQEDMETDRQAAEDLTTTGQSSEQQHRRSVFISMITQLSVFIYLAFAAEF